jgi:hypothetical protein
MAGLTFAKAALTAMVLAGPAQADTTSRSIANDLFLFGSGNSVQLDAPRDLLAAGSTVVLEGAVAQDTQAVGFDVDVGAATGADLYAMGFTVSLRGPVLGDVTASGMSVRTSKTAVVSGNARLAGSTVIIDGPISGGLAAAAAEVILNAPVSGDVLITAEKITFGPDARIGGSLTYSMPAKMDIPERVIGADRVKFEVYQQPEMIRGAHQMWRDWDYPGMPTFMSLFSGFLVTLGFFFVVGAVFLTLMPKPVQRLQRSIDARPGMSLLTGVIGLSILFGLAPITALTVVGLPLVPIVLLATVGVWTLGYVLGAYALAMRVMRSLGAAEDPSIMLRLLALIVGITLVALLNFIPFLGWMANFALVLAGIGAMTTALFERLAGNAGPVLDADMQPIEPKP